MPNDQRHLSRRPNLQAIPADIDERLSLSRRRVIRERAAAGWSVAFLRRAPFDRPTVFLAEPGSTRGSMLREDGSLEVGLDTRLGSQDRHFAWALRARANVTLLTP